MIPEARQIAPPPEPGSMIFFSLSLVIISTEGEVLSGEADVVIPAGGA